jgi:predicted permease
MLLTMIGWAASFACGIALQRRLRDPQRASHLLFMTIIWIVAPLIIVYAYTTVVLQVELLAAFAAAIAASWLTLLIGMVWGHFGGRVGRERGILAIATGMGNTGCVGFPLATIAFGGAGLALAAIYAEFQFLIPVDAVVLGLGRHYAGPNSRGAPAPGVLRLLRGWLLNPPVVAGAAAVALRLLGANIGGLIGPIGPAMGVAIGLVGFVQVGLATPLTRVFHDRTQLWRAFVTLVLRCGMAPLILYGLGRLVGIHIPGVFLLLAATPVAFNAMVVSAVFDLDVELARLLIITSTPLVIAGVLIWHMT